MKFEHECRGSEIHPDQAVDGGSIMYQRAIKLLTDLCVNATFSESTQARQKMVGLNGGPNVPLNC